MNKRQHEAGSDESDDEAATEDEATEDEATEDDSEDTASPPSPLIAQSLRYGFKPSTHLCTPRVNIYVIPRWMDL